METNRARLRRLQSTDFDKMRLLDSDPDIMKFTPMRIPQTEEQTRERIKVQMEKQKSMDPFGIWLAEEKQTGEFLGWFMLHPTQGKELELGFMLPKSQWGKGFATEVSQVLVDFAKAKKVDLLTARTSQDNFASIRVLEKLGFEYAKTIEVEEKGFGQVELKFFEMQLS